jgi:hypothetical protein
MKTGLHASAIHDNVALYGRPELMELLLDSILDRSGHEYDQGEQSSMRDRAICPVG